MRKPFRQNLLIAALAFSICSLGLSKQALAQAPELSATEQLAMELEGQRLLHISGLAPLQISFVEYFFHRSLRFLEEHPQSSFADIERALRSLNTGMWLLAVPDNQVPSSDLCIASLQEGGKSNTWIYLSSGSPAKAQADRDKFKIKDESQNLRNLETVGYLVRCTRS